MLESLFDLQRTNYKELKDCKVELVQMKRLWDLISVIDMQFDSWKQTLWKDIKADEMETLIGQMQKEQARGTAPQNKDLKQYRAFTALVERIKNMKGLSPLIQKLRSDDMKDRHWKKLQVICSQNIPYN